MKIKPRFSLALLALLLVSLVAIWLARSRVTAGISTMPAAEAQAIISRPGKPEVVCAQGFRRWKHKLSIDTFPTDASCVGSESGHIKLFTRCRTIN